MIPDFQDDGNLPPGIHRATWAEVEQLFGFDAHRKRLLHGFRAMVTVLAAAGCKRVFLDGSFAGAKAIPSDFDALWDMQDVDLPRLYASEPLFWSLGAGRAAQKAKYLGEMFPADFIESSSGKTFLEFFQIDKQTGSPKGIVEIDLGTL
jgi:hypothetical protein